MRLQSLRIAEQQSGLPGTAAMLLLRFRQPPPPVTPGRRTFIQVKPAVTGRLRFAGQHTISHTDRLRTGFKFTDFHPRCIPVRPEADTAPDPADKAPPQMTDMPEPVCSEAGIGDEGDGLAFRDRSMETVKEAALDFTVLCQFSGHHFTHQWQGTPVADQACAQKISVPVMPAGPVDRDDTKRHQGGDGSVSRCRIRGISR